MFMEQLLKLKRTLDNPDVDDELLNDLLIDASNIICDIRNSDKVESKYLSTQVKIAVELFNKRGVEGQTSHNENSLGRTYENANVSQSLLAEITPVVKTPFSKVRVIE